MTTQCVVRAARAGFPKMSKASFWGCAIPRSRSKAEIKNSALRRSDETESSRPCQTKIRFRQEGGFFVCIIRFSLFNIHYSFVFSGFSMKNE